MAKCRNSQFTSIIENNSLIFGTITLLFKIIYLKQNINNFLLSMEPRKSTVLKNYELIYSNGMPCNLGFGAYGSVQLGKCLKTGQTVAIKKINRKIAMSEVEIHMKLDHPNIIKMYDFCFDEPNQITYIVLEYAENGSLFDYIHQHSLTDKKMIKNIFLSVCSAISYMHSKKIMHRDIKPENILLGSKNVVKVCDFGFATHSQPRMTLCGTVQYMAPEMILKKQYNHKIDVWGLGILYFELIEGKAPFRGQTQFQVLEEMKNPIYFSSKFTEDEIAMIHQILKVDPAERPDIGDIVRYDCLRKSTRSSEGTSKRSTMQQEKDPSKKMKIVEIKNLHSEKKLPLMQVKSIRDLNSPTQTSFHGKELFHGKEKISLKRATKKNINQ